MENRPYIVLLGGVGTGKSTIVEKLTGATGRSSDQITSFTKSSKAYESLDKQMIICDTPGSDAMDEQFEHNLNIAHALNFKPVTCILMVIKADTRIDRVVKDIREYSEAFLPEDLPFQLLGVCITHMDKNEVKWGKRDLLPHLQKHCETDTAIFTSLETSAARLSGDIIFECKKKRPLELSIDGDLFLRLFRIGDGGIKIMRQCRKEVSDFETMKQNFYEAKIEERYDYDDQMNMTFEFQTWMSQQIIEAQKRLSKNNNFTFDEGPAMASEAGHVANMTNQLRKVLSDVRTEAAKYHTVVDSNFRKCPHCGQVWQKIEGCDGLTECGTRPSDASDFWSGVMFTFEFKWDSSVKKLTVHKKEERRRKTLAGEMNRNGHGAGCGAQIRWTDMAPVKVEYDVDIQPLSTKYVDPLPPGAGQGWRKKYNTAIEKLEKMSVTKVCAGIRCLIEIAN